MNEISVALASHNGGRYIRQQLKSIYDQTHSPSEVIICDDQSTDLTKDEVLPFLNQQGFRFLINETRLGVVRNFQKAIRLCRYDYIALSDQDDVWYRDKLELAFGKMIQVENKNTPALVFSDAELVNDSLGVISSSFWKHRNIQPKHMSFSALLFGNAVTGCTILMNRALANHMEEMPAGATMHDAWAALIAFGFGSVGIIEQPTLKYRQHSSNLTSNNERTFLSRIKSVCLEILSKEKRSKFLAQELEQAKVYHLLYRNSLSAKNRLILERFLALENHGFFVRKLASLRTVTLSSSQSI